MGDSPSKEKCMIECKSNARRLLNGSDDTRELHWQVSRLTTTTITLLKVICSILIFDSYLTHIAYREIIFSYMFWGEIGAVQK